ncbi:MAG: hypothetical protein K9M15_02900 [Candidatus Marinimicrobia bacterium]|nr:hypothetical protein [Candidatus Neomarinimicrobiota bacterium]
MINLLPSQNKKLAKKETTRRFFVVLSFSFLILLLIKILFSLSIFSYLVIMEKTIENQLSSTEKIAQLKMIEKLENDATEINNTLFALETIGEKSHLFSKDLEEIIEVCPSSVSINTLSLEAGENTKITFGGKAKTRNNLLDFFEKLKLNNRFKEVVLPVSSLLAEKDVDFSIAIEIE